MHNPVPATPTLIGHADLRLMPLSSSEPAPGSRRCSPAQSARAHDGHRRAGAAAARAVRARRRAALARRETIARRRQARDRRKPRGVPRRAPSGRRLCGSAMTSGVAASR